MMMKAFVACRMALIEKEKRRSLDDSNCTHACMNLESAGNAMGLETDLGGCKGKKSISNLVYKTNLTVLFN